MKILLSLFLWATLTWPVIAYAQAAGNGMEQYTAIVVPEERITEEFITYLIAKSSNIREEKLERKRLDFIRNINDTRFAILEFKDGKDSRLKDSTVQYLKHLNSFFNQDYEKVANDVTLEHSTFNLPFKHLLEKERAIYRLRSMYDRLAKAKEEMKVTHHLRVGNSTSLYDRIMKVYELLLYVNDIEKYYSAALDQEQKVVDAFNERQVLEMEQLLGTFNELTAAALTKVLSVPAYYGDSSLKLAALPLFQHYRHELINGFGFSDFVLLEENFHRYRDRYLAVPMASRKTEETANYMRDSATVKQALLKLQQGFLPKALSRNKERSRWIVAVRRFFAGHLPKKRR